MPSDDAQDEYRGFTIKAEHSETWGVYAPDRMVIASTFAEAKAWIDGYIRGSEDAQ